LTIRTAAGSNYFLKLVDLNGRTARAYYMHGGSAQAFPVPLGLFTLKYATGERWCSESDYFGEHTVFNVADKTLDFDQQVRPDPDGTTTLTSDELIRQRGGNLRTHTIPRSQF
jgi:hypothetical protein